jgi:hypothetical protein
MIKLKTIKIIAFLAFSSLLLNACKGGLPGADARKFPADPEKRIQKNIAEGKSLQMNEIFGNTQGGRVFDFASSNGLWRASLDVIDFMPLSSVNYSGGIIITDWYSENSNQKESIKISIRFMTNELRSDALNIKVFNRKCLDNLLNCKVTETSGVLVAELKKEILKKAAIYQEQNREKKKK